LVECQGAHGPGRRINFLSHHGLLRQSAASVSGERFASLHEREYPHGSLALAYGISRRLRGSDALADHADVTFAGQRGNYRV
jgi:hypothetical protein